MVGVSAVAGEIEMAGEREREGRMKDIMLYRALVKGDLESVKKLLEETPLLLDAKISTIGETPLHIAVSHGHQQLVKELLRRMDASSWDEKLSIKDEYGDIPLHIAARGPNTNIARELLEGSDSLMELEDADGQVPLTLAAIYGNREMLDIFGWRRAELVKRGSHKWKRFLSCMKSKKFGHDAAQKSTMSTDYNFPNAYETEKWRLFTEFIMSKQFGFALDLWRIEKPELKTCKDDLCRMAEMVSVFSAANQFTKFERWIYDNSVYGLMLFNPRGLFAIVFRKERFLMKERNKKALELLSEMCSPIWTFDSNYTEVYFEAIKRAIKCGNVEFVEEVLRSNPALLWGNKESGSIFHIAVAFRQEKIWNLIYGLTTEQRNKIIGTLVESNNMLHIAAYPLVVPDKALQKEGEKMVPDEDLEKQGEKMVRDKASKRQGEKMVRDEGLEKQGEKMVSDEASKKQGEKMVRDEDLEKQGEKMVSDEASKNQGEKMVSDEASKKQGEQRLWKIFSKAPGAAMNVQRELQWYKEVERMVPSSYKNLTNKNGETPPVLFTKWHSKLVEEGGKWMRETATSCTIVATLIVTVMFAAAFTVPGGVKEDSGNPHFLERNSFMVFVISDALSLFSSVTAVLMFLSILTSRFEEKDFLKALPRRLIIGLFCLFLSIAAMMVAFGATILIVLGERNFVIVLGRRIKWSVILFTLASVPVILFAFLQIPLFVDMVSSTYGRGFFNRKTKCSFFNNPNDYFPPEPEPGVSSLV